MTTKTATTRLTAARTAVIVALAACLALALTGCESFYELFVDESDTSSGVYYVIYDEDSTAEEIAAIGDLSFIKGDLRDELATYGLSMEITVAFDTETDSDATFSVCYYRNHDDEDASDYCAIELYYAGTYTLEDGVIHFVFEPEGYNMLVYEVGSDFASLAAFQAFSYAEDGSCGVWAYACVFYGYEDVAVVTEELVADLPAAIDFTVSGNKIVSWEFEE